MEELTRSLAVAAVSPIVRGFAVGRTIGRKGARIDGKSAHRGAGPGARHGGAVDRS
ncbi:MAG: DUF2090 domain-containing protein [Gammaproteobacteria bacterium]|nr:MAG: DUF2090 domain-containing protein [Gammaproteobacteria bacterium]TLY68336.1 MAG: DUF2090 domain-containing protein [Gammaproteobacteria bacterium]TLY86707.1 MAG: DUF2090 domain-containing protein [Gammaproteobacteria bacterium]